jgi:hypothetical protein
MMARGTDRPRSSAQPIAPSWTASWAVVTDCDDRGGCSWEEIMGTIFKEVNTLSFIGNVGPKTERV